ncbi:DUF2339 domain-containing protein [Microvirga splendida]|uniref:DUF2339 domain-containing protein n=1 Tax=Microvirga splendida TaxID=2795727 RepID=A0ABS0XVZ3_9HYPH|nr:DUF2339 domain-containing protein [Microvirga splendida]MBJ6124216.1 DUF2339 domain-containing protein [Microvirga splendida]
MEIPFLVLLALSIPVCAIAGLVLGLSARSKLTLLQGRVATLESELRLARAQAGPATSPAEQQDPAPVPEAPATEAPAPDLLPEPEAEAPQSAGSVPAIQPPAPQPAPRGRDFEETLGSRWAVWVGGVALALGGIFLVRYSIEQNLLSPATRIALGGLFALALIGAGEWLRRRESSIALPGVPDANVPSILTAAGTCGAFAAAYAAYALYGLIGPAAAFVTLGLIAVLTMVASTLHGPVLAALGLLGAMGSPLLVSSDEPQPWALVIYLAFVVLPAYGVARLRLWRWLALAAAIGVLIWTLLIFILDAQDALPAMMHLVLQAGLAALFLVVLPYRAIPDAESGIDRAASGVLLAFAVAAVAVSGTVAAGDGRAVFVAAIALVLLATGIRFAPAAPAAAWAALTTFGALLIWPIRADLGGVPENLFYQSGDLFAVRPYALEVYLGLALLASAAIAGGALVRLARSPDLRLSAAAWYAGAATIGPLLALVAAYWRVAALERSLSFALIAGGLALAFIAATRWLSRRDGVEGAPIRLALGAAASAALAALALGLTFAFDKGMLTVAFALTALGTAWVSERTSLPALRYAVGAIGLIVLGRLIANPTIVDGDPGPILINWLLWGYGVPAVAFLAASRLLERSGRDRIVQLTESLGIVFAAFLVFFEIRHALRAGDPMALTTDLLEVGLIATESLVFAILLTRLDLRRGDPVYRWGSLIFKALSLTLCAGGLLLVENPLLTDDAILGGPVFNALTLAYLLPSLLAAGLALVERRARPRFYSLSSAILSLLLFSAYVGLEIRRLFAGPELALWRGFTQGEQWAYSVALLVTGILLLGLGLIRNNRFARLASAAYLVLAVLKVFIVDLANLEGVMRALSFIALGLVLIGIGLVYQRLLAHRPGNAAIPV